MSVGSQGRRSAVEVLRGLPPVFDLSTFQRMVGVPRQQARIYLSRWADSEYVRSAGPRAGIYFNLIVEPDSPSVRASDALKLLYPSAILNGASVLHAAGWSTQIPARVTVAALSRPTFAMLDAFDVVGRRQGWFVAIGEGISKDPDMASFGIRSLTPAFALADALTNDDGWRPDPDDLDLDDADPDELKRAFRAMKAKPPEWLLEFLQSKEGPRP